MQNDTIYSKRGGGYTSAINMSAMSGRATWPLAKLVLRQNDLTFTVLSNKIDLPFSEIKSVGVTKSGYVVVIANDPQKSFGFTWFGLSKILDYLRSANVPMDDTVATNLTAAKVSLAAQGVFIVVFLALFLSVFLGGTFHLGPLAHAKFRQ